MKIKIILFLAIAFLTYYLISISCNEIRNKNIANESFVLFYLRDSNYAKLGKNAKFWIDTTCYSNKMFKSITTYIDTLENGYSLKFYESGCLEKISFYKDDLPQGEQKGYYENGALHYLAYYNRGKQDSVQKFYYENGKTKIIYNARGNKRVGSEYSYYQNGSLREYVFYNDECRRVYSRTFDSSKNLIKEDGNLIGDFELILHDSPKYKVGDSCSIFIFYAVPPNCKRELTLVEINNNLYPEYAPQNVPLNNYGLTVEYLLRKQGKYTFNVNYSVTDSVSNKKTESSRSQDIYVAK